MLLKDHTHFLCLFIKNISLELDKSKKKYTSSTSTVLEKLASQPPKCYRAQHREGEEKKAVAEPAKPQWPWWQGRGWAVLIPLHTRCSWKLCLHIPGWCLEMGGGLRRCRDIWQPDKCFKLGCTASVRLQEDTQRSHFATGERPRSHKNTHYKNCSLQRRMIHIQLCFWNLEESIQLLLCFCRAGGHGLRKAGAGSWCLGTHGLL